MYIHIYIYIHTYVYIEVICVYSLSIYNIYIMYIHICMYTHTYSVDALPSHRDDDSDHDRHWLKGYSDQRVPSMFFAGSR